MIFVIKVYIDWLKKPFITEKYDFFTYLKIQRDVHGLASLPENRLRRQKNDKKTFRFIAKTQRITESL